MPEPKKSSEELRAWYQQFAKELYEKVQIDVTKKEDLGRVKNFRILEWSVDHPTHPDSRYEYAYMPMNGAEYADPEPGTQDFQNYAAWMMKNLNPEVTLEKIQQLYDQSQAGTLMVFRPGGSISNMQQVLTDANGKISISLPASAYDSGEQIPAEQQSYDPPEFVKEPTPEEHGFPAMPVPPKNMKPSFLSRLGHLLGLDTDYTKKLRYEKALAEYSVSAERWRNGTLPGERNPETYHRALAARQTYLEEVAAFQANPYCKLNAIDVGFRFHVVQRDDDAFFTHTAEEAEYLMNRHSVTPLGKCESEWKALDQQLSYANRAEQIVHHLMGHEPHPELLTEWIENKVIDPEKMNLAAYELPMEDDFYEMTLQQQKESQERWGKLAEVAGFAALADYNVAGLPLREGFDREETAALNYSSVLSNVFTVGTAAGENEIACLEGARQKAQSVLYQYRVGIVAPMGELLARGLRQNMREAACLRVFNGPHAIGTLHLTAKILDALENNSKLMESSGLKPEELEEARGNAELYRTLTRGAEARKEVLGHLLGKEPLDPARLQAAAKDALFANYVLKEIAVDRNRHDEEMAKDPKRAAILEEMSANSKYGAQMALADETEKSGGYLAGKMKEEAQKTEKAYRQANDKFLLQELGRPAFGVNQKLLSASWVEQTKNQLGAEMNLENLLSGDIKGAVEIFSSNLKMTKAMESAQPEVKPLAGNEPVPERKEPEVKAIQI